MKLTSLLAIFSLLALSGCVEEHCLEGEVKPTGKTRTASHCAINPRDGSCAIYFTTETEMGCYLNGTITEKWWV